VFIGLTALQLAIVGGSLFVVLALGVAFGVYMHRRKAARATKAQQNLYIRRQASHVSPRQSTLTQNRDAIQSI
jgi:Flp pilus assembly protein TadG